tara:strand:- start:9 stop:542 length:534 start_codon:yes stop_codon:yes gene_type:complete
MPQGKGTYGSQVGRPSKKRTSYVNDNNWYNKLQTTLSFKHSDVQHPSDVFSVVSPSRSNKYGQKSVMEAHRKEPMSEDERDFRKKGGIETLAYKTRGITDQSKFQTGGDDYADRDYQELAGDFVKEQTQDNQTRINRDIAREVGSQRQAQMHMGEPSEYEARQNKKLFGTSMLTKKK